jgi:transforming growth factor-beta-induced protein
MFSTRILRATLVLGLAVVPVACGTADDADMSDDPSAEAPMTTEGQTQATMDAQAEPGSIVDVASEAGTFETLLAAAAAAGLVETLDTGGPFTLFAPTDAAFAALPEGTLDSLLADPDALRDILLYHVVSGRVTAADVVTLDEATSLQGESIAIMVHDGAVMVNDANVTATDIEASNGIIHVIDAVLMP